MKISSVNLSAMKNFKRKNCLSNPQINNRTSNNSSRTKLDNSQNISFGVLGIDDILVGGAFIAYFGLFAYSLINMFGVFFIEIYDSHVNNANRKKDIENTKQAREEKIQFYIKSMNITRKEAERYHDEFLSIAYIKPNENGHEKGLNAIMGYGAEKYDIAMGVLSPVISAQNSKDEQAKKLVPNGVLFYGPTGSGKTYMAEHISEHLREFGVDYKEFEFEIGQHEKNAIEIRRLFKDAEKQFKETGKYTVIRFVEDIDKKFKDTNIDSTYIEETAALMSCTENCASKGAIWIATANNPKQIEKPVLRRATIKMPIGNMKDFQIGDMLKYEVIGLEGKDSAEKVDYQKVVDYIRNINQDFTPDEYKIFVQTAKNNYGEINAENIIKEIDTYLDFGLYTLSDECKREFKNNQIYVEEINKGNSNGENN